ncbi:MAG: aminotransferase class V-fold PLP-dependent enzyme [Alphaproteobacteria bacterium]|nr:aminotransferase class V-fold PLP-dependent enzyme [Alphaproteobacteria bacterium]
MSELGSRALFPHLAWRIYLDHAAVGPLPAPALEAACAGLRAQAVDGVAAMARLFEEAGHVREAFAALVGADPEGVCLTGNTSDGVSAIATCLPWRPGQRVLLFEGEFPSNVTPWQQAAAAHGLELVWLPAEALRTDDGLLRVEEELRRGIRLVAVSAVQFQTGLGAPLDALVPLAHAHGALVFVDAIQAAGLVPLRMDATDVDFLACGGQKWLMGPVGTGVLAVRPDHFRSLHPRLASWLSHTDPLRFLHGEPGRLGYDQPLQQGPAIFEGGARNLAGHMALAASLRVLLDVGVDAAFAHVQRYLDVLEEGLVARGFTSARSADPRRRSGILSVRPPEGVPLTTLVTALHGSGVSVSTPDGWLRCAPSWPNSLAELPVVLDVVDGALAAARRSR